MLDTGCWQCGLRYEPPFKNNTGTTSIEYPASSIQYPSRNRRSNNTGPPKPTLTHFALRKKNARI